MSTVPISPLFMMIMAISIPFTVAQVYYPVDVANAIAIFIIGGILLCVMLKDALEYQEPITIGYFMNRKYP